ncbi:MAG: hypothetical protein NTZ25_03285 [Candidatus Peregrinibacteria bacterium]|nr:hypothetical protein [Candidatus Peregrinibacteria bacterium]
MVKGINVSDNKSVLRAIESLTKSDYLAQIGKKISSVVPTDKALKELDLYVLRQDAAKPYLSVDGTSQLKMPDDISRNDVTLSTASFVGPLGSDIKNDCTRLDSNELKTIIHSAVNFALSSGNYKQNMLGDVIKSFPLYKESKWCLLAIVLLGFAVLFFGKDMLAIVAACAILSTVFIITNISK